MATKKKKVGIIAMQPSWKELSDEKYTRFPEELKEIGCESEILFFDRFFISFGKKIEFYYKEKKFNPQNYSLFLPVVGGNLEASILLEALERTGVPMKNKPEAVAVSKDKTRSKLWLHEAGIPTVPAAVNFSQFFLEPLTYFLGNNEYVCKLREGSLGKGVAYINSKMSLISVFELLASASVAPCKMLFEKYIRDAGGKDFRIIVAGGKVVGGMERRSNGFDFRANIWGGGKGKIFKPTSDMKKIAIKSAQILGLDYAGVDMVLDNKKPLVVEVNSNPGMQIENLTGENVVGEIVKNIV
jgi:ribosomal protein S6--L-glutamate ligase